MTYPKQVTSPNVRLRWDQFLSDFERYVLRDVRVWHCDAGRGKHEPACSSVEGLTAVCDEVHSLFSREGQWHANGHASSGAP